MPLAPASPSFHLPADYARVRVVHSFDELISGQFAGDVNAICWTRNLPGDFAEVARALGPGEGIRPLDEDVLSSLELSAEGDVARHCMLRDWELLRSRELAPELNCIYSYPQDDEAEVVRTDVYSFHVDSAPVPAATWLCTYHGAPSEGLRNEEAFQRIADPQTRERFRQIYGGEEGPEFEGFLSDQCFDLHYRSHSNAQPFSFGLHNLWRIAVDHPNSPVLPCIHRAPATLANETRLLLIS